MRAIQFDGPAGVLEGMLDVPDGAAGVAVLCHPHPQYGGSMYDGVLAEVAGELSDQGYAVLRFNFRGVGGSDGSYDDGDGEVEDLMAAIAAAEQETGLSATIVGGYSFGAMMVLRACSGLAADKLLLVAPPVRMMPGGTQPSQSTLVILGRDDAIVDHDATADFFSDASVSTIEHTDHFFMGHGHEIRRAIADFLG